MATAALCAKPNRFAPREIINKVQKRNNGNDHEALHLIEAGKITPDRILSHKFSLADGGKAFATMGAYADGVIKPWVEL